MPTSLFRRKAVEACQADADQAERTGAAFPPGMVRPN